LRGSGKSLERLLQEAERLLRGFFPHKDPKTLQYGALPKKPEHREGLAYLTFSARTSELTAHAKQTFATTEP
jgi:hypothetical protein